MDLQLNELLLLNIVFKIQKQLVNSQNINLS